jgi:hypothetical protein
MPSFNSIPEIENITPKTPHFHALGLARQLKLSVNLSESSLCFIESTMFHPQQKKEKKEGDIYKIVSDFLSSKKGCQRLFFTIPIQLKFRANYRNSSHNSCPINHVHTRSIDKQTTSRSRTVSEAHEE